MGATIICREAVKEEISEILIENLQQLVDKNLQLVFDEVSVEETEDGLSVEYPMGEFYGTTYDYVEFLTDEFKKLKKKFKDIGIDGIVYEYETNMDLTQGFVFHCEPDDRELKVSSQWQLCAVCGKYFETDVFYNSSQWDFEEGNLLCLCSSECTRKYVGGECISDLDVEPNASVSEEDSERIWEEEITLQELLSDRLAEA